MAKKGKIEHVTRNKDFTGGMVPDFRCDFVGTTGEASVDDRIMDLAKSISGVSDVCLLAEMVTTAVAMARGKTTHGDFKLANRSLKEMRESGEVFHPYRDRRKVAVFGSARTDPEAPEYQATVELTRRLKELEFMTITGAGPGIMAAGNEGATREDSFGLNITLPFEASANEFIAGDPKLIDYNYFFTRKLAFVKEADAAVGMPGGFGTMDEVFEALTLIQTGKASVYPVVLLDAPGGDYWKSWDEFVRGHLYKDGLISESDFSLYIVTDSIDEAINEITKFYYNFHSYRYVGDRLVIRMLSELSEEAVEKLNVDFADLIKSEGKIRQREALPEEKYEPDLAELPRLVLRHRRRNFGRLRELIDAVNELAD